MNYQEQLTPWAVYQTLPDLQRQLVIRFRRRTDADCYIKVLKQTRPTTEFVLAFETNKKEAVPATIAWFKRSAEYGEPGAGQRLVLTSLPLDFDRERLNWLTINTAVSCERFTRSSICLVWFDYSAHSPQFRVSGFVCWVYGDGTLPSAVWLLCCK